MSENRHSDGEHRRQRRAQIDALPGATDGDIEERAQWFETVYESAHRHTEDIPWADLKAKSVLLDWLKRNPGGGASALDVACGLGDNAEALAAAGYATTAFDVSHTAVEWARERFGNSPVDYRVSNLFHPPEEWIGAFDLVHECYTLQSFGGEMREAAFPAVGRLVRPGGRLIIVARSRSRSRDEGAEASGPPWPLSPSEIDRFLDLGFEAVVASDYVVAKGDRRIPHRFAEFRRID